MRELTIEEYNNIDPKLANVINRYTKNESDCIDPIQYYFWNLENGGGSELKFKRSDKTGNFFVIVSHMYDGVVFSEEFTEEEFTYENFVKTYFGEDERGIKLLNEIKEEFELLKV